MNDADKKALEELQAYLAGRTEKTNRQNDKHILAIARRSNNETWLQNITESAKARELDPEYQRIRREKILSPEANAKRSVSSKRSLNDPEVKARHKASSAKTRATKEYQDKMAKVYADPVRRQKCRDSGRTQIKAVTTPAGQFESRTDAAKHYGITAQAMGNKIKDINHYLEFYYTDIGPVKPKEKPKAMRIAQKYIRRVKTPMGIFENLKDAATAHDIHPVSYTHLTLPTICSV